MNDAFNEYRKHRNSQGHGSPTHNNHGVLNNRTPAPGNKQHGAIKNNTPGKEK